MKKNNYLTITFKGYGHWKIATNYYGKEISCMNNDSLSVDDYNSEEDERDGRELRKKRGYWNLRNQCIREYQRNKFNQ